MLNRRALMHLLLFAALIVIILADFKNILRLTKIEFITGEKAKGVIVNTTFEVKALSRTRTVINFDTYVLKPTDHLLVNMEIFKKNSVRYLPYLVNVTVNVCKFLNGTERNSFYIRFMLEWINKYSNINHSCPYSGHVFGRNLEPFADKIPGFIPAGNYRLDLKFFQYSLKYYLATIRGYGTITLRPFIQQQN